MDEGGGGRGAGVAAEASRGLDRVPASPAVWIGVRDALTIGMPEPHAAGAQSETAAAPAASATQSAVKSGYARMAPNGKLSSQKVMPHLARSSSSAQALDT